MVGRILCNGLCNASAAFEPRGKVQLRPHLCRETGMSIAIQSSDELEELRKLLRKMSDDVLVSFGKAARSLCRNRDCPDTFKRQLDEARAELAAFNYRDSMATGVVPPHGRSKVWLGWQYTNNWDLALLFWKYRSVQELPSVTFVAETSTAQLYRFVCLLTNPRFPPISAVSATCSHVVVGRVGEAVAPPVGRISDQRNSQEGGHKALQGS
jgi:hypothetical protein